MLCYPEAARSVLRMVSLQRKQPNIKALLAITFLGLVFILFPQKYLGQSFGQQIEAISNISHPSPSLDFLRLWHPPWTRTPENNQATTFDSQGPACEKTLLFRFAGAHGFASEYLIFLRVFLLAKYFGFEVIIDDHQWNYGKWTDYFTPLSLSCSMPYRPKDSDRTPLAPSANDPPLAFIRDGNMQPLWTQASHVIWSIRKLDYLDQMILNLYTDASEVEVLHVQDRNSKTASLPLNTSETLPTAYKRVFDVMSTEVSRLWSLNAEMSGLVNSATASTTSRSTECRALIGAHVRLGDKALELHKFSSAALPTPRKTLQDLYNHWIEHQSSSKAISPQGSRKLPDRALEAISPDSGMAGVRLERLTHRSDDSPTQSSLPAFPGRYVDAAQSLVAEITANQAELKDSGRQPILLIMSDDSSGLGLLSLLQDEAVRQFRVFVGLDALLTGKETVPTRSEPDIRESRGYGQAQEAARGFHEATFNAMPLSMRIASTKTFLRDLTATAQLAEGLVFTGSSNVGRLLAMLSAQGRNKKKSFRSVDVRWFPTARYY